MTYNLFVSRPSAVIPYYEPPTGSSAYVEWQTHMKGDWEEINLEDGKKPNDMSHIRPKTTDAIEHNLR